MRWLNKKRLPILLGFAITIFFMWLHEADQNNPLKLMVGKLDNIIYDSRIQLLPIKRPELETNIVILDLDERSIREEGRWPWSRKKIADMLYAMAEAGVVIASFDIGFNEAERNIAEQLLEVDDQSPYKDYLQGLVPIVDFDAQLATAISDSGTDVVLGYFFQPDATLKTGTLPPADYQLSDEQLQRSAMSNNQGYTGAIDKLVAVAPGGGFMSTFPDKDGVVRKSPLILRHNDTIYASLALKTAQLYYYIEDPMRLESFILNGKEAVTAVVMDEYHIVPTNHEGEVLVPYRGGRNSFSYVSATDLLNGNLSEAEAAELEGAIVLIGTSAIGLLDIRATPFESTYPGVEVHANILDGLVNAGDGNTLFPSHMEQEYIVLMTFILFFGVGLSLVFPALGPIALALTGISVLLISVGVNSWAWQSENIVFPLAGFLLMLITLTATNLAYGYLSEQASRQQYSEMFGQYVPSAHIQAMMDDPDAVSFEGQSKEISVMFADIRSFTSISEKLDAASLKKMLNRFFTPITKDIFDTDGTIDKYVGDMVMAFWGAPLDNPTHRGDAVEAALRMLETVERLKPEFERDGLPEVKIGVGINTGFMNVGDMGSTYRRSYTVLGDAVNLGSRLESITKQYGVKLLVGEDTHDHAPDFFYRFADYMQVKGKEESIRVYEPLCRIAEVTDELRAEVDKYEAARALYLAQKWPEAKAAFSTLMEEYPGIFIYQVYRDRCDELPAKGLAADWDGTYKHDSK